LARAGGFGCIPFASGADQSDAPMTHRTTHDNRMPSATKATRPVSRRASRRPAAAWLPLLLSLALPGLGALRAQELDGKVATILAQADAGPVDRTYELGSMLADAAPATNTDAFRDAVVRSVARHGDKARLVAAMAIQQLKTDTTYGKDLLDLLKPVASSKDDGARAASMALLGQDKFFNARLLPDVRKLIEANCKDEFVAPRVRIEAALALWRVGGSDQQALAKQTLDEFLRSTDRELQVRGALALAEINTEGGPAWDVLREIQFEPTEFGRLARLYVQRGETQREFERMLADVVRSATADGKVPAGRSDEYRLLNELRMRIRAQHINGSEATDADLLEFAAKGMLQGLDQHSAFFTSDEFKRFFFDLNREYGGIGAFVNFDQDGDFSIVRPIYSGPAYKAGMLSGDKILEVDGWETGGHTSDEIIARLKGRPDTTVVLKVFRPGLQEPQELSITRQQIAVPAVNWAMVPGEIGYVELINFSSNISEELAVALADLERRGAKGLVLDVRNNTGGFLTQARDVVEQFVPADKLVVYTSGPAEERRDYKTRPGHRVCTLPMAVLTNAFSASASEITAGALQDHDRAVIVGHRTFGKGSVQNLIALNADRAEPFEDLNQDNAWQEGEPYTDRNGNGKYDFGAHIKLTVARYYLPSGRCPHREFDKEGRPVRSEWGVTPDKIIDLLEQKPEDAWKNAAVFAILKKGSFREYVKKQLPKNKELFQQLAEGDDGDPAKYPEFDAFYTSLDTKLSKDDVRRWLRYEVRDQVSDLRGAVYPGQRALGDPQEDAQLQEAVRTLLQKRGHDIRDIAAYKNVLKIKFGDEPRTSAK
jgi:carboxyl-terminal processing protease